PHGSRSIRAGISDSMIALSICNRPSRPRRNMVVPSASAQVMARFELRADLRTGKAPPRTCASHGGRPQGKNPIAAPAPRSVDFATSDAAIPEVAIALDIEGKVLGVAREILILG